MIARAILNSLFAIILQGAISNQIAIMGAPQMNVEALENFLDGSDMIDDISWDNFDPPDAAAPDLLKNLRFYLQFCVYRCRSAIFFRFVNF